MRGEGRSFHVRPLRTWGGRFEPASGALCEPALRSCLQHLPFALSHVPGPSGTFLHKGALGPGNA